MELNFIRGDELGRDHRTVSAELYNNIHLLFARCSNKHLFVPIRSMQYLAVIDAEEVVFIDDQGSRNIELFWCNFHPSERQDLHAPVDYTCIYCHEKGRETMSRLQSEFLKALELMQSRQSKPDGATIIPLERD